MDTIIRMSKEKALLAAIGSFGFVFLSVIILLARPMIYVGGSIAFLAGICGILFFGFCFFYFLDSLITNKEIYVINKKGITFRKKIGVAREICIPWADVSFIKPSKDIPGFLVVVKDVKKYAHSSNVDRFGDAFRINLYGCDISQKKLESVLKKYTHVMTKDEKTN